ncbi:hypothetical protein MAJ_11116, partial [Metarhizium majus ARSEF 297]
MARRSGMDKESGEGDETAQDPIWNQKSDFGAIMVTSLKASFLEMTGLDFRF